MPLFALAQQTQLSPGDVIYISLPGDPDFNKNLSINKDGFVDLPQAGLVSLQGMTINKAKLAAEKLLSRYYHDLAGFNLTLKEHRLLITVLGGVKTPGPVDLSSSSNFQTALLAAGGTFEGAQLDRMQLRRGNHVITVNYQKYLDDGDATHLPKLKALDTIFVPGSPLKVAPTRMVRIVGAVAAPGRFIWSNGMTLLDLIASSGGLTDQADLSKIKIIPREEENTKTKFFNLSNFINGDSNIGALPKIKPGYTVIIPKLAAGSTADLMRHPSNRSIYLFGAVAAPGRYQFKKSLNLLDILAAAGGTTPTADLRNIQVSHGSSLKPRVSTVNLSMYFKTGDESLIPKLSPGDTIYVPSTDRFWLEKSKESTVRIIGAVAIPGRYDFDDDMTILDLMAQAGGPSTDAYLEKIVVVNMSCCQNESRTFDFQEFAKTGDISLIPVLRPGDTVFIPDRTQSNWESFLKAVRDISAVLAFVLLIIAI